LGCHTSTAKRLYYPCGPERGRLRDIASAEEVSMAGVIDWIEFFVDLFW
jgi:hypothetical protein